MRQRMVRWCHAKNGKCTAKAASGGQECDTDRREDRHLKKWKVAE